MTSALTRSIACLLSFSLTGCFYGKVKVNSSEKELIPYGNTNQLIFMNRSNQLDTICLIKKITRTTNLDFFLDKNLGRSGGNKKPYYESYSTETSLSKSFSRKSTNQPFIKYKPVLFTFYKYKTDSKIKMYYNIDGRWNGSVSFDTLKLDSIILNDKIYNDVFVIENEKLKELQVEKIYWSIKYGLVKINEKNGEQWTLIKTMIE